MKHFTNEQLKQIGTEAGFKYKIRAQRFENYKASATFDPNTLEGRSYGWWSACTKVGPFVVFNACKYSNCTSKHLRKMRSVLHKLRVKIDFEIYSHKGLDVLHPKTRSSGCGWREQMSNGPIEHLEYTINELVIAMNKPRSRKSSNELRKLRLVEYKLQLEIVRKLLQMQNSKGAKRQTIIRQLYKLKVQLAKAELNTSKLNDEQWKKRSERAQHKALNNIQLKPALTLVGEL